MAKQSVILIIDDEADVLKMVSRRLSRSGFSVLTASSGLHGLKLAGKAAPDLILLDISMPEMDGFEVLRRLRKNSKTASIPVMMLSGLYLEAQKVKALRMGADDYVTKPYDPAELMARINALIRRAERPAVKKIKHVLITGGAGFIGSHLTRALLEKKLHVHIVDDFSTGRESNLQEFLNNKRFHLVRGSITDEALLSKAVERCDLVYHLAATVGVKNVVDHPLDTLIYDTFGTGLLLKYASAKGVKVVLASTSEVYGKSKAIPFREDADLVIGQPEVNRWSYACSKLLDEFLAIGYHRERGLPVVIVRFFNIVGPGQVGSYGMVIPRLFKSALTRKPMTIYGDGEQIRCFTYIDDAVRILMKLAESDRANGEIVNLGSDHQISIAELAKKIKKLTGSSSKIVFEPYSKYYGNSFQDIRKRVPDLTKLKKIIGETPSVSIDEILRKAYAHLKSHPEDLREP